MILLDTHAWVWWSDEPHRLSEPARKAINANRDLALSVISCWEVAMLVEHGRLKLSQSVEEWIEGSLAVDDLRLLPLTVRNAVLAGGGAMHWPHKDPADRMIVATAIEYTIPLITTDQKIHAFPGVTTIW